MASGTLLRDIDENFLQCSICLNQFREPKLLPCLHRYCKICLKTLHAKPKTKITCPECREEHTVPAEDGVDGFKTDFNTNNIVEFIQLRRSLKGSLLKICVACGKEKKLFAYCFRCHEFLCRGCHEYHMTNVTMKDHVAHTLSLDEIESRNITVEKLASLKEATKCHHHEEQLAQLCCKTCHGLPVCMACGTFGKHKGHDLHEVTLLAEEERKKLQVKYSDLLLHKDNIYKMTNSIQQTTEELKTTVKEKKANLQKEYDLKTSTIMTEIIEEERKFIQGQSELRDELESRLTLRKEELGKDMEEAKAKYENACQEDKRENDIRMKKLEEDNKREKKRLHDKQKDLDKAINDLMASLRTQEEKHFTIMQEMSDHFKDLVTTFENVSGTAASILPVKHDWTDVQCIPDVCTAIDQLSSKMKREFPELNGLSEITTRSLSFPTGKEVRLPGNTKSESEITSVKSHAWRITDITSNEDGSIVITGPASNYDSHITVTDISGKVIRQDILKATTRFAKRYCSFISQFEVATVCCLNEIGVYDIRDGTYVKVNISVAINSWPVDRSVSCVATDPENDRIYVGGSDSRDVYVFTRDLKYVNTLILPRNIRYPHDIITYGSELLVSDNDGRGAFVVSVERPVCKMMYECPKPDGWNWEPGSVCKDNHGFIYMIWNSRMTDRNRCVVAQYSQDDCRTLVTTTPLDDDASCMATTGTDFGEELQVATYGRGKIITYTLMK